MRTSTASLLNAPNASMPEMPAGLFIIELEERLELATVVATALKCLSEDLG
jgi:hypothetical protein